MPRSFLVKKRVNSEACVKVEDNMEQCDSAGARIITCVFIFFLL